VTARTAPSTGAATVGSFARVNEQGSPQVFLVEGKADGGRWYRVLLPVRPNGTAGYVSANAVALSRTLYRVEVDRAALRLVLWRGCDRVAVYPVAVGAPRTPTPAGSFYLTSLLEPASPGSVYGAYAYGLSGYSSVIRTWRWGGVVGLHGTNDPSSIGRAVSHGCVRMRNADIARLVRVLPLGTPVTIG
jgi:lipoprotein-anchoring transpeptidase ErfK/SrfK